MAAHCWWLGWYHWWNGRDEDVNFLHPSYSKSIVLAWVWREPVREHFRRDQRSDLESGKVYVIWNYRCAESFWAIAFVPSRHIWSVRRQIEKRGVKATECGMFCNARNDRKKGKELYPAREQSKTRAEVIHWPISGQHQSWWSFGSIL